jgi:DsbC/DsbD-like thiol-disulfide interchange protein
MIKPLTGSAILAVLTAILISASSFGASTGSRQTSSEGSLDPQQTRPFSPVKEIRLVVLDLGEGRARPSEAGAAKTSRVPVRMGISIELEEGWHLYWSNPGDAGLAPSVHWTLPPGFSAGPLRHPVPEKTVEADIVSFEHENPTLLICDIHPAPSYPSRKPWKAEAVFEWMACRDSCVTGETAIRAVVPPESGILAEGWMLLEEFSSRFPNSLSGSGLTLAEGKAEWTGSAWRIELTFSGPHAAHVEDFYPYLVDDFVVVSGEVTCRGGIITFPVIPSQGASSPPPSEVGGLILINGTAYEITAVVEEGPEDPGRSLSDGFNQSSSLPIDSDFRGCGRDYNPLQPSDRIQGIGTI